MAQATKEARMQDLLVPFRASHPLDFELVDGDDQQVIYIDDVASGHDLNLTIRNASGRSLFLLPLPQPQPGPANHHLQLRFRRGVLSAAAITGLELTGDADWKASAPIADEDGVAVYLLRVHAQPWQLNAGKSVALVLRHVSAAAGGGSRATRVALSTRNISYDPTPAGVVDETRTALLNIIDHHGRKETPFHIGFFGSNSVLNIGAFDGGNNLRLRIANVLRADPLALERSNVVLRGRGHRRPTQLSFVVETEPQDKPNTMPWALARSGELGSTKLNVTGAGEVEIKSLTPGSSREWVVEFKNDVTLAPDQFIEVEFTNITTSLPSGVAHLAVRLTNVPGFWDNRVVLLIEKSPIHFQKSNVGVGIAKPHGFHVALPEPAAGAAAAGVRIGGGKEGNASIKLRNKGTGTPYIDFVQNETNDYDARLRMAAPGRLLFESTKLGIGVDPTAPLDVDGNIIQRGHDFALGRYNNARGDTGMSRALVKDNNAVLVVNYDRDFSGGVVINGKDIKLAGQTRVLADSTKLTLAHTGSAGKAVFLELYAPKGDQVYPAILFHQSHVFWHRIEARPEGFQLKSGDTSDNFVTLQAGALRIGNITIGENELRILKRLADGQLEFDFYNVKQDEYMYAADFAPFDSDRRRVFTWRRKGRVEQGRWRIHYPW